MSGKPVSFLLVIVFICAVRIPQPLKTVLTCTPSRAWKFLIACSTARRLTDPQKKVSSGVSDHLSPSTGVNPNLRNSFRPRSDAARYLANFSDSVGLAALVKTPTVTSTSPLSSSGTSIASIPSTILVVVFQITAASAPPIFTVLATSGTVGWKVPVCRTIASSFVQCPDAFRSFRVLLPTAAWSGLPSTVRTSSRSRSSMRVMFLGLPSATAITGFIRASESDSATSPFLRAELI